MRPALLTAGPLAAGTLVALTASGWRTADSMPGGVSERLDSRFEQNLLPRRLTNDTYPLRRYDTAR
jgi:hypothetical protein